MSIDGKNPSSTLLPPRVLPKYSDIIMKGMQVHLVKAVTYGMVFKFLLQLQAGHHFYKVNKHKTSFKVSLSQVKEVKALPNTQTVH